MATYQILERDGSKVTAKLTADNGYSEVQSYIPPEGKAEEDCLAEATRAFNSEIMKREVKMGESEKEVFPIVQVKI